MARGGSGARGKPSVIAKCGIERKTGFLYFIDKQGDISCVKMSRGGRKKKAKKATKKKAKKATKKKAKKASKKKSRR